MTSIYYMLTRESDHQWWALNESDHVHYHHAGGWRITLRADGRTNERRSDRTSSEDRRRSWW